MTVKGCTKLEQTRQGFTCTHPFAGALEDAKGEEANGLSSSAPVLTRAGWQCGDGYAELTERFEIMRFDFSQPLAELQGRAQGR